MKFSCANPGMKTIILLVLLLTFLVGLLLTLKEYFLPFASAAASIKRITAFVSKIRFLRNDKGSP
jgi:hypothetical protein